MRYVERNPLRAKSLGVRRAERWRWSSLSAAEPNVQRPALDAGPVPRGAGWLEWVNEPIGEAEVQALRASVVRGRPFGSAVWQKRVAGELGLEFTMRPRGRPRKGEKK